MWSRSWLADAITLLSTEGDHQIPVPLAERAVAVLGGHPFYLQLLGEELTTHEPPYDDVGLKAALQQLLFSPTGDSRCISSSSSTGRSVARVISPPHSMRCVTARCA